MDEPEPDPSDPYCRRTAVDGPSCRTSSPRCDAVITGAEAGSPIPKGPAALPLPYESDSCATVGALVGACCVVVVFIALGFDSLAMIE